MKSKGSSKVEGNRFDKYSSVIGRVNIPLPDFNFYHRSSDECEVDDSFVGRKYLIRKLSNWLRDEKTKTGAYLVAGYRGMGKSSFVGKVLHDISLCPDNNRYYVYAASLIILVLSFFIAFGIYISYGSKFSGLWLSYLLLWRILISINILPFLVIGIMKLREWFKKRWAKEEERKIKLTTIKVNLGHEILNERELLSLVVKNVLHRYEKEYYKSGCYFVQRLAIVCFSLSIIFFFYFVLSHVIGGSGWNFIHSYLHKLTEWYVVLSVYVILFYFVRIGLLRLLSRFMGRRIIKRLVYLNERIESVVSENDNPVNIGSSYLSVNFNTVRKKSYPQASVREIEQELIEILDAIADKKCFKLRLVFVFDELDKLDPELPQEPVEKDRLPEFEFSNSGFSGGAASRARKQSVLNFLSKLKFFLTTARCKFIFISGRELYDAYLADVSDREFAVSSIFNGVIYVNSFLSEEESKSIRDISTLTEHYICKKLLYGYEKDKESDEYTFSYYYKCMSKFYKDKKRDERELIKALLVLYQFSLYLSHVCNGSPKKITIHFEQYVRDWDFLKDRKNNITLPGVKEHENYYLSFSYRSQVVIGFVHYMAYPVIQAIINRRSEFGDKLLVSASFLINHIYKHHSSGFSWRNMEYIPELMEVNKTPEFRAFIGYIIDFLSQSHIRNTESGLYRYKFPMRVIEEISLNSKYSEEVAAIFNFTLDESLSVKKHYDRLLHHYAHNYKVEDQMKDAQVLASIYHILGDLYMADEDYSQAILEFKVCAQILENKMEESKKKEGAIPASLILFYVRNALKLGSVYEKRNTWDPAYVVYSELITRLVEYKSNTSQSEEHLRSRGERIQPTDPKAGIKDNLSSVDRASLTPERCHINMIFSLFDDIQLTYLPSLMKLAVLEKMEPTGIVLKNLEEMEEEFQFFNKGVRQQEKYIIAADFFRKVGEILYYKNGLLDQPTDTLKNLFITGVEADARWTQEEKNTLNKIQRGEKELSPEEQEIRKNIEKNKSFWEREGYCKEQFLKITRKGCCLPCYACKYYSRSLSYIIENMLTKDRGETEYTQMTQLTRSLYVMQYLLNRQNRGELMSRREDALYITASTLDGFANVMLSCSEKEAQLRPIFMDFFFKVLKSEILDNPKEELIDRLKDAGEKEEISPLERAVVYYWDAAMFYKYAGHRTEAASCTKKILRLFFAYLRVHPEDRQIREMIVKYADIIKDKLIRKAIINLYSRYEFISLCEIQKVRDIFEIEFVDSVELSRLTLFPDIEEFCYLYFALQLASGNTNQLSYIYKSRFMLKYRLHSTMYERIRNLQYKALFNRYILRRALWKDKQLELYDGNFFTTFCDALSDYLNSSLTIKGILKEYANCYEDKDVENGDKLEFLEFLLYDSHLCLTRLIDYVAPSSDTTLFTNSFIGNMYQRLFEWNNVFRVLYMLYRFCDIEDEEERQVRLMDYIKGLIRKKRAKENSEALLVRCFNQCIEKIKAYTGERKNRADQLKNDVFGRLIFSDLHLLESSYQAEMAIRFYQRSKEMHSEGRAYKSMIRGLHILDDDLNNDTCQFDFAIERYLVNSDYINVNMEKLKDFNKASDVYKIEGYIDNVTK